MRTRGGFTLIEVLMVIVVIGILALIVVPRIVGVGKDARDSSLRSQLQRLRSAVVTFEAQCGDYPAALTDIMATAAPSSGGNGTVITSADFRGPYLSTGDGELPDNPVTGGNSVGTDWLYTATTGDVRAAAGTAVDGTDYSTW